MKEDFGPGILPSRAIYPSSRLAIYLAILGASKFLRACGLFLSYDLLKVIHIVQFLCIIKAGASLPLIFLQKPFSSGKRITKNQWFRVLRHAFVGSSINLLWLFGLTLCGPLRTIALFEHSDLVVLAAASALFSNNGGGPAKFRGALIMLMGVIGLLLFDHDDKLIGEHTHSDHSHHAHSSFIPHIFNHIVEFFGWSDHKGGVVLLFLTLCLQAAYNSASRKLSVDVGGAKRLHALSTFVSAILLLPWAGFIYFTTESDVSSWTSLIIPLTLVVLSLLLVDFYVEAIVGNHVAPQRLAKWGVYAVLVSALLLGLSWTHPLLTHATSMNKLQEIITEDHVLSGGVFFSVGAFALATHILVSPNRVGKGSFIGYSSGGLPLYSFTGDYLQRTSHSLVNTLKNGLKQILEDVNSRKIFYFLCINFCFTFVELLYGVWTNSLGLISDGFHMLFDCSALVMGLYAAVMSHWKATRIFSYGYDRAEVLSGFINGLFLVVIAFFVFTAALGRLVEPPEVKTEKLLTVSVIGLCVNLMGIMAFHGSHGHSHGGHGHSHGGHGHSHGGQGHSESHGHSHGGQSGPACQDSSPKHNSNMEGVFLHVLADTLGSVGVIISSILIEHFGWNIADPLCSLFIAILIFVSVFPLLRDTATILLLSSPSDKEKPIENALQKVMCVEGVMAYRDPHLWAHTSSKALATLHLQITPISSEQKIISQVTSILKEAGLSNVTLQIEKESYFHHLAGLSASFDQMVEYTQNFKALTFEDSSLASVKSV